MPGVDGNRRRGKRRGMRSDRDCFSCRSRAVKCDLNRPRCLPCVQAGLTCGNYPQRVVWVGEPPRGESSVPSRDRNPHPIGSAISAPTSSLSKGSSEAAVAEVWTEADKHSSIKYLAAFCRRMKASHDDTDPCDRQFSEAVGGLVSGLCDYMEARVGSHTVSMSNNEEAESTLIMRHHLSALRYLNKALETANPFSIIGIATLTVLGICDDWSGEWQFHLQGARCLIDYHCHSPPELDRLTHIVPGGAQIVAWLLWWDLVGTLVKGTQGLVFDDSHRQILDKSFFDVVGCPANTFDLLIEVAKGQAAAEPLCSCVRAMREVLMESSDISDQSQAANAYRCAAAVAVLSQMDEETMTASIQGTLTCAVDRLCHIIHVIKPSSPYYIHLGLAVYLAGINASTSQQCDIVRSYWQGCSIAPVPRYRGGLARCEETWRDRGIL